MDITNRGFVVEDKIECLEHRTLKTGIVNTKNNQVTASTNPVFIFMLEHLKLLYQTLKTTILKILKNAVI